MVDAPASGAGGRKAVEVRVLSWAPAPLEGDHKNIAKLAEICHLRAGSGARSFAMFHRVSTFLGAPLGASPLFWV